MPSEQLKDFEKFAEVDLKSLGDMMLLYLRAGAFALTQATREAIEVNRYAINLAYRIAKTIIKPTKDKEERLAKAFEEKDLEEASLIMLEHIADAVKIERALVRLTLREKDVEEVYNYLIKAGIEEKKEAEENKMG